MLKPFLSGLLATVIAVTWYASPILKPFPELTGSYQVGTKTIYLTDTLRLQPFEETSANRFLECLISYPTDNIEGTHKASYLGDKMSFFQERAASHFGIPKALVKLLFRNIKIQAYLNAPIAINQQQFPVVLYSHGLHGLPTDFDITTLEELASHGYIVIGINHPYFNDLTLTPDKKVISGMALASKFNDMSPSEQKKYQTNAIEIYKSDAKFLIDELHKINQDKNSEFFNRLDLDHIGIMGHSAGGTAAIETCRVDQRCKAAINLDGWFDQAIGNEPIKQPLLLLFAEKSIEVSEPTQEYLARKGLTRDEYFERERTIAEHRKKLCASPLCSMVILPGLGHGDFGDGNLEKWPMASWDAPDGYGTIKLINGYIVKFFDAHLKKNL